MDIKHIASRIDRIAQIVDSWSRSGEIPAVERGIVERTLAELYETVRFDTPAPAEPALEEPVLEEPAPQAAIDIEHIFGTPVPVEPIAEVEPDPEPEPEPVVEPEPEPEPAAGPEPEPVAGPEQEPVVEPEPEAVAEPESEPEPEPEPVAEPEPEPKPAAEPEPEPVQQTSLFDMEVVRRPRTGGSRKIIMSLYGEPAARPAARKVEKPAAQEPETDESEKPEMPADHTTVLGEVINAGTTTVADAIAASQPEDVASRIAHSDRIDDLNRAIGVNDKFIMIRDLFDGDSEAYAKAIADLNSFTDFDECLVYIASNYRWNPDSDGTRMLMDLLTRKLL